ncbi:hypothetical protein, partial [Kibdelosporangium persicum]
MLELARVLALVWVDVRVAVACQVVVQVPRVGVPVVDAVLLARSAATCPVKALPLVALARWALGVARVGCLLVGLAWAGAVVVRTKSTSERHSC